MMSDVAQIVAPAAAAAAGRGQAELLDNAFRSNRNSRAGGGRSGGFGAGAGDSKKAKGFSRELFNLVGSQGLAPIVSARLAKAFYVQATVCVPVAAGWCRWRDGGACCAYRCRFAP
jgi:hypothetical protein